VNPVAPATYTITELADEFDVTPRAIRFYEEAGLLDPARKGRNRVYHQRDRTRLKLTLRGKRLGLSLQEIKQLVDMYDSEADTAPPTAHNSTSSWKTSKSRWPRLRSMRRGVMRCFNPEHTNRCEHARRLDHEPTARTELQPRRRHRRIARRRSRVC
jgi:DNA-binding transcriptional MerR regulator